MTATTRDASGGTGTAEPGEAIDPSLTTAAAVDAALAPWFGAEGALARVVPGYLPRAPQLAMAAAVREAIARTDTLIVEAGTGTGKTFAYLVPAMLEGGKVVISTGTKTLQDQLFQRDIPVVRAALHAPVTVALLKGRANYLCHYHLRRALEGGRFGSRQDVAWLRRIEVFAKTTQSGDKAELADVPETAPVWQQVTSTRENCLGSECPDYKDCFVMRARREAQQADVVVVNHHLFFADLLLKDTGVADLLPTANTIIFDEAHQLPEVASDFFGETVSTNQVLELARDAMAEGLAHARDAADWPRLIAPVERAARDLRLAFGAEASRFSASRLPQADAAHAALARIREALATLGAALEAQAERHEGLAACARRAEALGQTLAAWSDTEAAEQTVRWVETFSSSVQLHRTPLALAPIFTRHREGPPRAWIFTSATLAVRRSVAHYAEQLGLDPTKSLLVDSPFDYPSQAMLYVPRGLPMPAAPGFTDAVVDAALPLIEAAGGGAFVLCTTLRAVTRAAERLRDAFAARGIPHPILVQGEASRTELLDRFRSHGHAVLVGSQSFWEGIDVRGDALRLVVIDKLPFAPPDDPVLAARLDELEKKGRNPFIDGQLPMAAITLKQGAGRLIRAETDRGLLMIADARLVDKPYGRQLWQSLPPFRRSRELDQALAFLAPPAPR